MSIEKALKLKAPQMPKDLKDKDIAKAVSALAKALPPLVAAVGGMGKALSPALSLNVDLMNLAKNKHADKNSDDKTKNAAKELYSACYWIDKTLTELV
jgi:hypothetical protein